MIIPYGLGTPDPTVTVPLSASMVDVGGVFKATPAQLLDEHQWAIDSGHAPNAPPMGVVLYLKQRPAVLVAIGCATFLAGFGVAKLLSRT